MISSKDIKQKIKSFYKTPLYNISRESKNKNKITNNNIRVYFVMRANIEDECKMVIVETNNDDTKIISANERFAFNENDPLNPINL